MDRRPPTLDMRLDGSFNAPPPTTMTLSFKLMVGAVVLTVAAGAIAFAALALWVFAMVLPVLIGAALVAWGMIRYRRWQISRRQAPGSGRPLRPL